MTDFLHRLKLRCIWSWAGWLDSWRTEHSFRSWVWANLASAALAFTLPLSPGERALILSLDQHELAKQAKDAGSAAVAVTAIAAGVAWVVVLWG